MAVQYERIKKTIAALAAYGTLPQGGTTRLSYTAEYLAAQAFLQREMLESGMLAEVDPIGNLIGTYVGREPELTAVMSGSHLDTVPAGGNFDGALGIVAALECVRSWQEEGYRPKRTVQVIATIEEECTAFGMACFGVRVRGGEFKKQKPEFIVHLTGGSLAECLQAAGLPHSALQDAAVGFQDLAAFVELHIEQGPVLESEQKQIGIVDSIVGIVNYELTIQGSQNHAGTTSMSLRHDPVVAAAEFITESTRQMMAQAPSATLTYGAIQVFPGMQNVIADRVNLLIDLRDGSDEKLLQDVVLLKRALESIERKGFQTRLRQNDWLESVQMDPNVIRVIERHCEEKHLAYKHMNSGAGHDSMVFGKHFPTAMIFVPSVGGISHNPAEATAVADIQTGFELLCDVLKELSAQTFLSW